MIDIGARKSIAENRKTETLIKGMKDTIVEMLKSKEAPVNEEVLKLVVKREDEPKLLEKIGKIGDALAMVYKAVARPITLPSIFRIKGDVRVIQNSPTRITNLSELEKYFSSLEGTIKLLAQAASMAPAPQIKIPDFPKFQIPKADNSKIEELLNQLNENLSNIKSPEFRFPKEIMVGNFPRTHVPTPVTHISINSLNGYVKTTAATVTSSLTPLPTYGVLSSRRSMIIYNNGSVTVYIGGSDVTSSNGLPVPASTYSPPLDNCVNTILYGVTSSSTSDVRVMEISDEASGR